MKSLVTFTEDIRIKCGITIKQLVNYQTQPAATELEPDGGTLAIQSHVPSRTTLDKNIRIKVWK